MNRAIGHGVDCLRVAETVQGDGTIDNASISFHRTEDGRWWSRGQAFGMGGQPADIRDLTHDGYICREKPGLRNA